MSKLSVARLSAVLMGCLFACGAQAAAKNTTVKLTGTRGAAFEGRLEVGGVVRTVSGTLPARFEFTNTGPDRWEFRKTDRSAELRVTTYRGCHRGLRVNVKPGMLGAKLDPEGGWHYEVLE